MVPNALNEANRAETGSISLLKKYNGTSGMPNQPVAKIPVKANVMNSHRARSLYKRLKDLVCQETLTEALDWWIAGLSVLDSVLLFLASSNLNTKSWFLAPRLRVRTYYILLHWMMRSNYQPAGWPRHIPNSVLLSDFLVQRKEVEMQGGLKSYRARN